MTTKKLAERPQSPTLPEQNHDLTRISIRRVVKYAAEIPLMPASFDEVCGAGQERHWI